MQVCTKCNVEKETDDFYSADNKRGTMAACKSCKKRENKAHRDKPEIR